MSLDSGTRLGPYTIEAPIGAGGMGEVYRAQDTRLGRMVAIKVLPESVAKDPERLGRFEREAKLLASLNHPHIAALYGLEESGGVPALVMELVEGPTLEDRIHQGALPLDETLKITRQVAEAVEYAHAHGIIHRDLKPANVKLTRDDRVKVLDFGLAKALDPATGASGSIDLSHSPTLTYQATVAGVILGTAAYMSPEQARGKAADKQADVWALGCLIFEMLGGERAFGGETVSDTLASVLKSDPDWDALPAEVGRGVRRVLKRCLEKDPALRFHSALDVAMDLESTVERDESESVEVVSQLGRSRSAWLTWGIAAVLAVTVIGLAWHQMHGRSAPVAAPSHFELSLPEDATVAMNHQWGVLALSRDGRKQAYMVHTADGTENIAVRDLDESRIRVLANTEGANTPFFSPDGEWLGFTADGKLWRIPVKGGPRSTIADGVRDPRGATWSSDGYIYAAPDSALPLQRVRETGGSFEPVDSLQQDRRERTQRWPQALPDGSAVLFTSDTTDSPEYYDDARIEAIRPSTGGRNVILEQSSCAWFLPPSTLLYARGGTIFAVPFDPERLEVRGAPVVALQGVSTTVASGAVHLAVSELGSLLYLPGSAARSGWTVTWIDRAGNTQPVLSDTGADQLALGPDGRRVALSINSSNENSVWVVDLERGTRTKLTFDEAATAPVWSPDGLWIAYATPHGIYRKRADGSGNAEQLVKTDQPIYTESFTPDGRHLLYSIEKSGDGGDIMAIAVDGKSPPQTIVQTPALEWMSAPSPDGQWLAYTSNETGRSEVYVRSYRAGGGRWQISDDSGFEPRWSADGSELYYRDGSGTLWSVPVQSKPTFSAGAPIRLFGALRTGDNPHTYGVSPDGKRFLSLGLTVNKAVDRVDFVTHWDSELRNLLARNPR